MFALTNCTIYTGKEEVRDQALLIEHNRIIDCISAKDLQVNCPITDAKGYIVAPGFIDLQLNGCGGVMFNDAIEPNTLNVMHQTNLKSGTTSFLPTLITSSDEDMMQAIEVTQAYRQSQKNNSQYGVLGLHLEGPYFNRKRKGIHNEAHIRQPDRTMLKAIAHAGKEVVRIMTLAPEMVEPDEIRLLADAGIVVSGGHTDATYEQAIVGFDAGVQMVTHLFNAMSPWQGRNPGVVGAVFDRPEIYAGIIADGYHVHYASIRLAHQLKQDKLVFVTDATPPVGTTMDSFQIGGHEVFYRDGKCVSADGTLGGSALTMIEAVANAVNHAQISPPEALRMASTYPAHLLGLDQDLGYVAPGYVANLAIFDQGFHMRGIVDRGILQWFE